MNNDTDAVFIGEAEINSKNLNISRSRPGSTHSGEENTTIARGGVDADMATGEQDPLLPSESRQRRPSDAGSGHEWVGIKDFDHLPWYRRPSIYWVLAPFFVMTLAFGAIISPRINLILNLVCREYMSEQQTKNPGHTFLPILFDGENPQCRSPEVQARVAQFTLYGNLIAGLLSAITSPKLGALSDRFGRTKILALTSMGIIAGDALIIMAATKPETFPVNWILVGYALDGLSGSFIAAMAIANAYATDCTPPARRNISFGYLHGCLFTGIALGPILGGLIVKATGKILSIFYASLAVHAAFILFIAFCVPESLSKRRQEAAQDKHQEHKAQRGSSDWIDRVRAVNILEPLKILWPTGEGSSPALRRNLVLLAAVDTILFGVAMGSMTIIVIYARYQFNWESFESSIFLSIVNTCRVLCLIVVLPLVTRYVRGKASETKQRSSGSDSFDLVVVRVAVFFDTLGYLGYTLARTGPLMILSGSIASIGGIGSPTLQSALTKHVPHEKTGQLLGASGLLHALARVIAPTIFNAIYSVTVGKFTQTVFVCLTVTFGLAFVLSFFIRPHVYLEKNVHTDSEE
ncbi:MFS transporter [Aureobasidium subglaciale]|nr:MFS transporter [Aureobasidium subglaciale]